MMAVIEGFHCREATVSVGVSLECGTKVESVLPDSEVLVGGVEGTREASASVGVSLGVEDVLVCGCGTRV